MDFKEVLFEKIHGLAFGRFAIWRPKEIQRPEYFQTKK